MSIFKIGFVHFARHSHVKRNSECANTHQTWKLTCLQSSSHEIYSICLLPQCASIGMKTTSKKKNENSSKPVRSHLDSHGRDNIHAYIYIHVALLYVVLFV